MLGQRDQLPHFDVVTVDGSHVRYADLWQHRNLVFVSIGTRDIQSQNYIRALQAHAAEFVAADTSLVISREQVPGLPSPGVVVADRWGEIVHVFDGNNDNAMPQPSELLEWTNFVRIQCPECPP